MVSHSSVFIQVVRADFNADPYVRDFGISVDQKMVTVTGRILPPPLLQYGGKVCVCVCAVALCCEWNGTAIETLTA